MDQNSTKVIGSHMQLRRPSPVLAPRLMWRLMMNCPIPWRTIVLLVLPCSSRLRLPALKQWELMWLCHPHLSLLALCINFHFKTQHYCHLYHITIIVLKMAVLLHIQWAVVVRQRNMVAI